MRQHGPEVPLEPNELANEYYGMRHGISFPLHEGVIVSNPINGTLPKWGLMPVGREASLESVQESDLTSDVLIYTSHFSRAIETAEIAQDTLGTAPIIITELLRERCFGELELTSSENYGEVWGRDTDDPNHNCYGAESVNEVLERTIGRLLIDLEGRHTGEKILLVSHADPLQIMQAWFRGIVPRLHRVLLRWEPSEIRRLNAGDQTA